MVSQYLELDVFLGIKESEFSGKVEDIGEFGKRASRYVDKSAEFPASLGRALSQVGRCRERCPSGLRSESIQLCLRPPFRIAVNRQYQVVARRPRFEPLIGSAISLRRSDRVGRHVSHGSETGAGAAIISLPQ